MNAVTPILRTLLHFLLLTGFVASPVQAAEVADLYQAAVPVASRDDTNERQRAFAAALREVLVKLTGRTDVDRDPVLQQALREAQTYVASFAYRNASTTQLELETLFYRERLQELIDSAGLALWPANRPETLLWVAVQESSGTRQMAEREGAGGEWLARLQAIARARGVPLALPLLDLEDRLALRPDVLWSFDADALRRASERYEVESILAVRIYPLPGEQVFARAVHLFRDQVQELDAVEIPATRFLEDSIAMVAQELAAHYAILLSGVAQGAKAQLVVDGVQGVDDYAALLDYLDRLAVVQSVEVREVSGTRLVLALDTGGQLRQLIEVLALDRRLLPLVQAEQQGGEVLLQYQWQTDPDA